ncbi:MAG TPA: PASTA domain-containing protein [Candidatus Fimivicinus intestinavium]|nr:PASTA domain-containing protein [Candidatus Fimivicinus intestinavium]
MNKKPSRHMVRRSIIVLAALLVGGFGLDVASLVRIQLIQGDEYRLKAESQQLSDTEIQPQRGIIYDRNKKVLAQSANVWLVYINPSKIPNDKVRNELSEGLAKVLEMEKEDVLEKAKQSKYGYVVVKKQVEKEMKDAVSDFITRHDTALKKAREEEESRKQELKKEHKQVVESTIPPEQRDTYYSEIIFTDPDVKRYYPNGHLASTVLGFTGTDGVGRWGLEAKYDETLAGTPGRILTAKNAGMDSMDTPYETTYDAKQGNSLVLTIDEVIQYYLEKSLDQARVNAQAKSAYGIVMDVETGGILAMATKGDFDPNDPHTIADEKTAQELEKILDPEEKYKELTNAQYTQWRNRAITDTYEPGSVFKVITASAAVEEDVVPDDFTYTCTGVINVAGTKIHCHKRTGHGKEDFTHGLMNSCNPFFITVGQMLGAEKFYKYFEAFGFTEKTGIDLPSETAPVEGRSYHTLDQLGIVELASTSFGQTFEATAIQILTAVNAIANGGKLMQPYIVSSVLDEEGNTISTTQPTVKRQVISEKSAATVANMMEQVVSEGTGKNAYVAGFRLAGKTGTSEKLAGGGKKEGKYVASFVCFAPANDPKISMLIVIDEPVGQINGGQIATPVAAEVAEATLNYLNVDPQYTAQELADLGEETPSVTGLSLAKAREALSGFTVKTVGEGSTVVSQMPAAGQLIPQNGVVVLYTDKTSEKKQVTVPDLTGLSVSEANQKALEYGLNPKIFGNSLTMGESVSYKQSEAEGSQVDEGTVVTIYFKSNVDVNDLA